MSQMYEQSLLYKAIKYSGFPLVNRLDRCLLTQDSELWDLTRILSKSLMSAFFGYFIGKIMGHRETLFCLAAFSGWWIYLLASDYKLKSENKYQTVFAYKFTSKLTDAPSMVPLEIDYQKKQSDQFSYSMKPEVINAQYCQIGDLIAALPDQYFDF